MLYLVRSPSDTAGFCSCEPGLMDAPYRDPKTGSGGGADGRGWMFTCVRCRRGFDRAVAREIPGTLPKLARSATPRTRELWLSDGTRSLQTLIPGPADWLAVIEPMLGAIPGGLVPGREYAYLDGHIVPRQPGPIRLRGWTREHDLPNLPHLAGPPLGDLLTSCEYWEGEPLESVLPRLAEEYEESVAARPRPWWKRLWPRS